uniref:Acetoacetyl-CoA synthetase n=1 Tax=Oryctolagus cuniculus TaxID=9986 RepID=A0A5F9DEV0_RABIT
MLVETLWKVWTELLDVLGLDVSNLSQYFSPASVANSPARALLLVGVVACAPWPGPLGTGRGGLASVRAEPPPLGAAAPQSSWLTRAAQWTSTPAFLALLSPAPSRLVSFAENYNDLYHWSVESYPDFWAEFWKFSGLVFSRMYDEVVDTSKGIADVPEWFRGSRLNYAENLLRHTENDRVALYVAREGREEIMKVTFEELRQQVALFAAAMRKMGVKKGDRVAGYLPNSAHAVEAMLAAASIGAIWSSTSPDFGVNGVLDRFSQIQPKLMFSVEAVVYNGKEHSHMEKLQRVVRGLPDLEKVVVIPYVAAREQINISKIPNSVFLDDFLATGAGDHAPQLEFEQLPFSHPLFIMFSSGTTGAPKCMVHSAGGTLIQHLKEHMLHGDMTSGDVLLYYTTVGWMMWNWMVSALATGASVVLYDGSPLVPTPSVLWDLVDSIGITILGTGAKWLSVLEEKDMKPVETHSLQTLRTILSTGSPLKAQSYDYVYRCIKSSVLLGSISGGTDIISCFMGQNSSIPVHRGEIQARNLAMAVEAWDEEGRAVWGQSGELVCTSASLQPRTSGRREREQVQEGVFLQVPRCLGARRLLQNQPQDRGHRHAGPERRHAQPQRSAVRQFGNLQHCGSLRGGDGQPVCAPVQQGRRGEGHPLPEDGFGPHLPAGPGETDPGRHPPGPVSAARSQPHPGDPGHPVHTQRQESGGGCEAGHCGEGRGASRGLLQPRHPGPVPEHP